MCRRLGWRACTSATTQLWLWHCAGSGRSGRTLRRPALPRRSRRATSSPVAPANPPFPLESSQPPHPVLPPPHAIPAPAYGVLNASRCSQPGRFQRPSAAAWGRQSGPGARKLRLTKQRPASPSSWTARTRGRARSCARSGSWRRALAPRARRRLAAAAVTAVQVPGWLPRRLLLLSRSGCCCSTACRHVHVHGPSRWRPDPRPACATQRAPGCPHSRARLHVPLVTQFECGGSRCVSRCGAGAGTREAAAAHQGYAGPQRQAAPARGAARVRESAGRGARASLNLQTQRHGRQHSPA